MSESLVSSTLSLGGASTKQFITFYSGGCLFGIDILLVREINRNLDITEVDLSASYVSGVLNLRGQVVTVLDLSKRLELDSDHAKPEKPSCIVLKTNSEIQRAHIAVDDEQTTSHDAVGLLVDAVGDVVSVPTKEIETPSCHNSGASTRYLDGVYKLENDILLLLKVSVVLEAGS